MHVLPKQCSAGTKRKETGLYSGHLYNGTGNQTILQYMTSSESLAECRSPVIQRHPYDELLEEYKATDWSTFETSGERLTQIGETLESVCQKVTDLATLIEPLETREQVMGRVMEVIPDLLKKANAMSKWAEGILEGKSGLEDGTPQYEILRSLYKFPHIILPKEVKISLANLPDILREVLGEEEASMSEIGMFRSSSKETDETLGLGLILGRKAEGRSDVGAFVSSPGENSRGFQNTRILFLAHTHPISMVDRAQKDELKKDREAVKDGSLEMVLRSDKRSLLLYDEEREYNKKGSDRTFENDLIPIVELEILKRQFSVTESKNDLKAMEDLFDAITKEYKEANDIQKNLKEGAYTVDEYNGQLKTLHEKLLHSTDWWEAVKFLETSFPNNALVIRKKEKREQEREQDASDPFDLFAGLGEGGILVPDSDSE